MPYPKHGTDCTSCHEPGTFDVPDQSKSLPGLLSATDKNETWGRSIGELPSVVVGPGARACGGCHRAELLNEDAYGDLVALNVHMKQGGYVVEAGEKPAVTVMDTITKIMEFYK
jgi:hypothetical protein